MHNKKLKSGVAALALGAVLVGGTLAWLFSADTVINNFNTVGKFGDDNEINILEIFDTDGASKTQPGVPVNKDVQVQNISDYNAIIKATFTKQFVLSEAQKEALGDETLDNSKIILGFDYYHATNNTDGIVVKEADITPTMDLSGKWVEIPEEQTDGTTINVYYYIGNVAPQGFTSKLLDSVTLDKTVTDSIYKDVNFEVVINAESTQAVEEAVTDTEDNGFGLSGTVADALKAETRLPAELGSILNGPINGISGDPVDAWDPDAQASEVDSINN